MRHLSARMLDEGCIDQFLRYHLPRCDCLGGALRTPNEAHAALVPMLEILRIEGVIARTTAPAGPIADELRSYNAHMRDARGLAAGTRTGRLRIVERLLVAQFAGRPVVVGELQTDDIRQFIAANLDTLSPDQLREAVRGFCRSGGVRPNRAPKSAVDQRARE